MSDEPLSLRCAAEEEEEDGVSLAAEEDDEEKEEVGQDDPNSFLRPAKEWVSSEPAPQRAGGAATNGGGLDLDELIDDLEREESAPGRAPAAHAAARRLSRHDEHAVPAKYSLRIDTEVERASRSYTPTASPSASASASASPQPETGRIGARRSRSARGGDAAPADELKSPGPSSPAASSAPALAADAAPPPLERVAVGADLLLNSPVEVHDVAMSVSALLRLKGGNAVVLTGPNASEGSGVGPYDGPGGMWDLRRRGARPPVGSRMEEQEPSFTHFAVNELMRYGYIKYVVTECVDGLHIAAGLGGDECCELQGSIFREICSRCGREYLRSFDAAGSTPVSGKDCFTGRMCEDSSCFGRLQSTLLNSAHVGSTNMLRHPAVAAAAEVVAGADLVLVLGSDVNMDITLHMVSLCLAKRGVLALCNYTRTPLDGHARARVVASTDEFLQSVVQQLDITVTADLARDDDRFDRQILSHHQRFGIGAGARSKTPHGMPVTAIRGPHESAALCGGCTVS